MNRAILALWISLKDNLGITIFCSILAGLYMPTTEWTHTIGFMFIVSVLMSSIITDALRIYESME